MTFPTKVKKPDEKEWNEDLQAFVCKTHQITLTSFGGCIYCNAEAKRKGEQE